MVSKTFDFGLTRGLSIPQAASDGKLKTVAIEAVRIFRAKRRPKTLRLSARAETMV
jgi:hypothetical protein